ncbi:hypothetical protein BGX26_003354 [Mortierella sp. AD094]|nr:hypothetical protein BGX26_003354 [Mortierella sp. AD094]
MLPYVSIIKAACVIAAGTSFGYSYSLTAASKEVQSKKGKGDKLTKEAMFERFSVTGLANFGAFLGVSESSLYILLMILGPLLSDSQVFKQLSELKTWHWVATILGLAGLALRKWSFDALGRFFTAVIMNGGLLDSLVFVLNIILAFLGRPFNVGLAIPYSFLGQGVGFWYAALSGSTAFLVMHFRVKNEEKMLKEHFGEDITLPGNIIAWGVDVQLSSATFSQEHLRNSEWGQQAIEPLIKEVSGFKIPYGTIGSLINATPKDSIAKVFLEDKFFETWTYSRPY